LPKFDWTIKRMRHLAKEKGIYGQGEI
jgi:hypothetical protein